MILNRILVLFFFVVFLSLSCEKSSEIQHKKMQNYASFKDIPGVTPEEIKAIEAIKEKRRSFVYGMVMTDEAFYSEPNKVGGFSALVCDWLSEIFGIPFKPAIYNWNELVSGLEAGYIDFTGELTPTDKRRETYFMTDAITYRSIKYIQLAGSVPHQAPAQNRPLRYAFFKGSTTANDVSKLLKNENFEVFFADDFDEIYRMLKSGEIDAFFGEGIEAAFDVYGDITAKDFLPLIYSPVSISTQLSDLEPIISVIQKMLQNEGIHYLTELYNQGRQEYIRHKFLLSLSEEELEYIQTNPVVSYVAENDNYPVSFYNKHNNQWQGIFFDILDEIEALTKISFKRVNELSDEWPELLKMLEEGQASIISELIPSEERKGRFLWPRNPILQDKFALVSKDEHRYININEILRMKIGVVRNSAYAEQFKTWFPSHSNVIEYEGNKALFKALENNEIDMSMSSQCLLLFLTNYMEQPNYKVNILFEHSFESTLGLNSKEVILNSIIDKALEQLNDNKISGKWMHKTFDYRAKIAQSRLPWLVGASILLLLVIVLLLILHHRILSEEKRLGSLVSERTAELSEQRKLLEHMSLTDQLTDLPNRRNFDNRLKSEWRRATREKLPISILMMDIDKFKTYNDTYGHQQGDALLQAVSKSIMHTINRPGDFAARWGGEEFVVLLSNTDAEGALWVAESIRSDIENLKITLASGSVTRVTISIGVNMQVPKPSGSIDPFISAADDALYRAKRSGRNRVCI